MSRRPGGKLRKIQRPFAAGNNRRTSFVKQDEKGTAALLSAEEQLYTRSRAEEGQFPPPNGKARSAPTRTSRSYSRTRKELCAAIVVQLSVCVLARVSSSITRVNDAPLMHNSIAPQVDSLYPSEHTL